MADKIPRQPALQQKGVMYYPYYYQSALDDNGRIAAWPFPGGPEVLYYYVA